MTKSDSLRFERSKRLLDVSSFGRVFKKATHSQDKFFTVLCRKKSDTPPRLGMAISKKNCRKATARNRIKRIVRESFRHHQGQLAGLDIVVINQPATALARNDAIIESLEGHFKKCSSTKHKLIKQES